jgi:hypothetical protein
MEPGSGFRAGATLFTFISGGGLVPVQRHFHSRMRLHGVLFSGTEHVGN